ncbi:MAG: ABC-type transport auxiliary lipoprotein family protein [Thiobacillaceae bacterium]
MKKLLWIAAFALSGCVNFGDDKYAPTLVNYVLEDTHEVKGAAAEKAAATDPRTLLVLDTTTTAFYDGDGLVYSRVPGTREQYRYARWTERPGKRFADLLRARLDAQSGFATIATAGGQVRGDVLLDTELTEFYHDAETSPGSVRVVLRAELIDLKSRTLIGRKSFEQHVALPSYDAPGAALGFSQASSQILDDIVLWLAAVKK